MIRAMLSAGRSVVGLLVLKATLSVMMVRIISENSIAIESWLFGFGAGDECLWVVMFLATCVLFC